MLKCHLSTAMHCEGDLFVIFGVDSELLCLETETFVMWLAKNVLLSRQSGRNGNVQLVKRSCCCGREATVTLTLHYG